MNDGFVWSVYVIMAGILWDVEIIAGPIGA